MITQPLDPAMADILAGHRIDADAAKLAARKLAIAGRFPQLDDQIIDFCAENGLTDEEINGALIFTKQRAIAKITAQRFANRWTPPSSGKRRRR